MAYNDLDLDELGEQRDIVHDEVVYGKRNNGTYIPLGLPECDALAMLLRELGEIAMHAPGGHQFLIDEASVWAGALSATEKRA